ncbi:MAG: cation:proton antiporter [Methylococcales bacterium]|jgi:multicomponent Na+:H+ antiporter subunit F|nr:cation:proton antiporter [Methylococcales bacterium]MBT7408196.1 cation:proton antiporter [Methylococcales bacterium]
MAESILNLAIVVILLAVIVGIICLMNGANLIDRVISLDFLTIITMALIVIIAHLSGRFIYVDVAIVYGLLSFLGVMAVTRYIGIKVTHNK